jgi:hypothetical protein
VVPGAALEEQDGVGVVAPFFVVVEFFFFEGGCEVEGALVFLCLPLSLIAKSLSLAHQSTSPAPCLAGGACENEDDDAEETGSPSPPARSSSGRLPLPLSRRWSSKISAAPASAAPPMTDVRRVAAFRRPEAAAACAAEARAGEADVLRGSIAGGRRKREKYEN